MQRTSNATKIRQVRSDRDITVPDWSAMLAEDTAAGRMPHRPVDQAASTITEIMAQTGLSKWLARRWVADRVKRKELELATKYEEDNTGRMQLHPAYRPIQKGGKA